MRWRDWNRNEDLNVANGESSKHAEAVSGALSHAPNGHGHSCSTRVETTCCSEHFGVTQHTVRSRFERSAALLLGRTGEGQEIMLSTHEDDCNEVLRHGLPTGLINFQRFCSVHVDAQCVASVVSRITLEVKVGDTDTERVGERRYGRRFG